MNDDTTVAALEQIPPQGLADGGGCIP